MNFKKILSIVSLLTIILPSSLNIVSCSNQENNKDLSIIKDINKINNLEIFITAEEENETVFSILGHTDLGISALIFKNKNIFKNFEKEFFKLDFENIYFDKNKIKQVFEEDKIIGNVTYYFQYLYRDKENNFLIPVKIKYYEISKEEVINRINKNNYYKNVFIDEKLNYLLDEINPEFIKTKLDKQARSFFNNDLFKVQKIIKRNYQELTDNDLKKFGKIEAEIIYDYDLFKNQKVRLRINIDYSAHHIVNEVVKNYFHVDVLLGSSGVNFCKNEITGKFVKDGIENTSIRNSFIEEEFLLLSIININTMCILNDNDFKNEQTISAVVYFQYQCVLGSFNLIVNVFNLPDLDSILESAGFFKYFENGEYKYRRNRCMFMPTEDESVVNEAKSIRSIKNERDSIDC